MTPAPLNSTAETLPQMPRWVTSGRAETLEDEAFLSGAALAQMHFVLAQDTLPQALLRERLALRAAEACVGFSGRPERAAELRDVVHLMRPGNLPGPAGALYQMWRRAAERPVSVAALHRVAPGHEVATLAAWLEAGQGARSPAPPWCWKRCFARPRGPCRTSQNRGAKTPGQGGRGGGRDVLGTRCCGRLGAAPARPRGAAAL